MQRIRSQLLRIAPYFRMALITGEDGTGKETVARALHERSVGADGPFVVWRATEFDQKLHHGSTYSGLMRAAHRGTLFLDGIGRITPLQQASLLQFLEQRKELRSHRYDLRVVAASHRELRTSAATGQFLEELYKRIAAVEIAVPPLRSHLEDVLTIAKLFLQRGGGTMTIASETASHLTRHNWPGNLRELSHVLEEARASARYQGRSQLEPHHLPLFEREPEAATQPPDQRLERLQDVVQQHVLNVLTRCAGNKLRASEVLGISRSTLYRMLDASTVGIDPRCAH